MMVFNFTIPCQSSQLRKRGVRDAEPRPEGVPRGRRAEPLLAEEGPKPRRALALAEPRAELGKPRALSRAVQVGVLKFPASSSSSSFSLGVWNGARAS